ncbi:MAG: exopolysaccharide biosynthesis protein [Caulobacterales bacterium]|nr:exopolysaccharide biosynthesis protein [Caulobacterales bacterium]
MTAHPLQLRPSRRFSDVLLDLGRRPGERLTLDEMVDAFGERALGAVMILIAVISLLPWPPGGKVVFSLPLMIIASEVALQRQSLWLPDWLLRRSVSRAGYAAGLGRMIGVVRFIERLSRPRLAVLTGPMARLVIGLICLLLAIMLAFPVPFGDLLPALTIIILGFALMQRDGVATLIGLFGTMVCLGYLALVWRTVSHLFGVGLAWVQGLAG